MQMSHPRKCPDCEDGHKPDGKLCATCCGSGRVHLVPAMRPQTEMHPALRELWEGRMFSDDIYG